MVIIIIIIIILLFIIIICASIIRSLAITVISFSERHASITLVPAVDPALRTIGEVTARGGARHELHHLLLLHVTTDQARRLGALETLNQEGEARESPRKRTQYAGVSLK